MARCFVQDAAGVCALGDTATLRGRLFEVQHSPLQTSDAYSPGCALPLGRVATDDGAADTRNNRLLDLVLAQLQPDIAARIERVGRHRVAVVIGSSTSGIAEGEAALAHHRAHGSFPPTFRYAQQELSAPAQHVARALGITGPAWTVSTACTSGAKAIASAARALAMGACDLAIAGGADSLCQMTVRGFSALEAVSDAVCNPFSRNRRGINIGEGAALMVLGRDPTRFRLAGSGESSDAHHISAPHPRGTGAVLAMRLALADAGLEPGIIDYLNTHGTATEQNDRMEAIAIAEVLGAAVPCGSTKPLTGHTLGAAGALEALFCWLTLERDDGSLPRHLWDGEADPELAPMAGLALTRAPGPVRRAMSNSFAFGGNNISLIFETHR